MEVTRRKAYAKINLGLRIIRKRSDGYHDLETVFQTISLCDEITFTKNHDNDAIYITSDSEAIPTDETNICYGAARLLQKECKTSEGAIIDITKRIPVGAGLGGGSSDAAHTLLGLQDLWEISLPSNKLITLACRLGADVPFFMRGGTAFARGIGDRLQWCNETFQQWVIVIYPNCSISTRWAYNKLNLDLTINRDPYNLAHSRLEDFLFFSRDSGNEFESVIFENYPKVKGLKEFLVTAGADYSCLSGSGSSVFGLFETKDQAQSVCTKLQANENITVFLSRCIGSYG